MERRKLLVLVWSIAIIALIFSLIFSFVSYEIFATELIKKYESRGIPPGYVNPPPYTEYMSKHNLVAVCLITGFAIMSVTFGIAMFYICIYSKRERIVPIMTILLLAISPFTMLSAGNLLASELIPIMEIAQTDKPYVVNVIIYFDEEYTDYNEQERTWRFIIEGEIQTSFRNNFNVYFSGVNVWLNHWDSDDSQNDAYYMLQEAIEETGFTSGMEYRRAPNYVKVVDYAIYFTKQAMDLRGLSPPMWNATIIRNDWNLNVIVHELSHQFWVYHCNNWCVMNPTWAEYTADWCDHCKSVLNNNRDKWDYKWTLFVYSVEHGGTVPQEGIWYNWREGKTVTITAYPDEGYEFHRYYVDRWTWQEPYVEYYYVYDNPTALTINADYYYQPQFKVENPSDPSPAGFGGRSDMRTLILT